MPVLFRRASTLNVHGRLLQDLDFDFRVDRSLTDSPNTCDITVFNLNEDSRRYLQSQKGGVNVELHAGYVSDPVLPLIFLGQLRELRTYSTPACA